MESDGVPEVVEQITADRSLALSAPMSTDGRRYDGDDARNAIRYVGSEEGVEPVFQVVHTRVNSFPLGAHLTSEQGSADVCRWARANADSLSVIDVDDDDAFEPTDYPFDPLADDDTDA